MIEIAKVLYASYGKYISKFRAIPYYKDLLRPVERRMLLSLYDVARSKFVKSAKVVGHCMGNYHPHAEAYNTLVRLVKFGFGIGQGNWGSRGLEDDPPAAMRYTEVKLNPIYLDIAFKYVKFVKWDEFEFAKEPEYLPAPIPLGLIGEGLNQGIAFHKTTLPYFRLNDLFTMLFIILGISKDKLPYPYIHGYISVSKQDDYIYKTKYELSYNVDYEINVKAKEIQLRGVPYNKQQIIKYIDNNNLEITDYSTSTIDIRIKYKQKKHIEDLEKLLVFNPKFHNIVVDEEGHPIEMSLHDMITNTYSLYKDAIQKSLEYELGNLHNTLEEMHIIAKIRDVVRKYHVNTVKGVSKYIKDVHLNKIENVMSKYSIKKLVEIKVNINDIEDKIKQTQQHLDNINSYVQTNVIELANKLS